MELSPTGSSQSNDKRIFLFHLTLYHDFNDYYVAYIIEIIIIFFCFLFVAS